MAAATDPYAVLGVPRTASDEEVRTAYRKLVKATHPDHNGGSPEAATRFEAVQAAYADIQQLRKTTTRARTTRATPPPKAESTPNPAVDARLADLERQVREAAKKAERAARKAAARATTTGEDKQRPTDEELGYVTTDDTIWKIIGDARTELSERFKDVRDEPNQHPVAKRVSDLIDGLESLTEKLDRKPPPRR